MTGQSIANMESLHTLYVMMAVRPVWVGRVCAENVGLRKRRTYRVVGAVGACTQTLAGDQGGRPR